MKKFRTIREVIKNAKKKVKPNVWKWLDGSAEYGHTTIKNREIFRKIGIVPRVLNDTKNLNIEKKFLEKNFFSNIIITCGWFTTI